ncbi:M50 family metallopeptidase [Planctomycetota bacterium]
MRDRIDGVLAVVKWPVVLIVVLLLPASAWALWDLLVLAVRNLERLFPFVAGFLGYSACWYVLLRRPIFGAFLSTFEHELTHAIFAWLTLHRVTGFRATWRSGGRIRYMGRGNWLITISPYFFPTAAVAVMLAMIWVPQEHLLWVAAALGVSLAYHVTSTYQETHGEQTDLQSVGHLFSLMFLPTANVLAVGFILAFALGGASGLTHFLEVLATHTQDVWRHVSTFLTSHGLIPA